MTRAETINNPKIQESTIIRTEYDGVQVTIEFDETAEGEGKNVKQIIMDMLTRAYERRITGESTSLQRFKYSAIL